jgi:plasmid stabilization system protein ParE
MTIVYADGVFEELIAISFYLADIDEELAQRFLNACDETFNDLVRNKYIGAEREFNNPALAEVRMWRVKSFENYLIFYIPMDAGIKILHVLHGSMDYRRDLENQ